MNKIVKDFHKYCESKEDCSKCELYEKSKHLNMFCRDAYIYLRGVKDGKENSSENGWCNQ